MAGPLGSAPGIMLGVGVGAAASAALAPVVEPGKQLAWKQNPNRILDPGTLARLVAQGAIELGDAQTMGRLAGYRADKVNALVYLAQTAPDLALTLELWRRGQFGEPTSAGAVALVDHALAKAQLEHRYWEPIKELFGERLAPPVIALAIVRGIMADPGFLPVGPPATEGKVRAFPVSPLDTLDEARAHGFDRERLFVETAIAGRPMGPESAASAAFRGILERVDYDRAIAEGDVRNEWADAIFETARQIPSVANYVTAHLKAWIDADAMNAGVARHGMSPEDAHLLYLAAGRPAAPGQMATAAARGIDGPDGRPMDRAQFLKGIAESDIRPEWGPMLWESRYLYPPLFQLTRLVQAGAIDAATAREWAEKDRYPPEVVTALHRYWLTLGGGDTADKHAAKAETQLWTALHRSYLANESNDDDARYHLDALNVPAAAQTRILDLWGRERGLVRKQLTPAQVKKAWAKPVTNPATGSPWTRDEAISALLARGYSYSDASTFLDE